MKLFVSDIDGTLYWYKNSNNSGCSNSCKKAIAMWIETGNLFAVATARVNTKRDFTMRDIGFDVDYLGGNGAEIVYRNGDRKFCTLPIDYFVEVGEWIDKNGYDSTVKICIDQQFIAYRKDLYPFYYEPRMRENLRHSIIYDMFNCDESSQGVNMSVITHPDHTKAIELQLKLLFEDRCQVFITDTDNIDFLPLGVDKGLAVVELAHYYKIPMEDVIVIGDASNDICMFDCTKNSYCMSHSSIEIQCKATNIVDSVEEAIYRELLKKVNK